MFNPNPGLFNHIITIQDYTQGKDSAGGQLKVWDIEVAVLLAGVNYIAGTEQDATRHGGEVSVSKTIFTAHYVFGVTEEMRVLFNGKHYDIKHVNNFLEKNQYLILTCQSGVNNG